MLHFFVFTFLLSTVLAIKDKQPKHSQQNSKLSHPLSRYRERIEDKLSIEDGIQAKDTTAPLFTYNAQIYQPHKASIQEESSTQGCGMGHPIIERFVDNFKKNVEDHKDLINADEVRELKAEAAASYYYYYVRDVRTYLGFPDAEESAKLVYRAVADNAHKLNQKSLLDAYARIMAERLFYIGHLNRKNVDKNSNLYFEFIKKGIKSVTDPTEEKMIRAVADSNLDFLSLKELITPESLVMGPRLFAQYLYRL